jgi:hypothetical protein
MKKINLQKYFLEIKYLKAYIFSILVIIFLSYIDYAFLNDKTIIFLAQEDGFFEDLTAICFLAACVLFFLSFLRSRNIFLLCLAFVVFFGAGEEISWGQRILGFKTPDSLAAVNVQHEFNIHNIAIFNDRDLNKVKKTGWHRLLEINILYRVFSMGFLVGVPLFFYHIRLQPVTNRKIRMPVPPVTIGIFFFISWAIFYSLKYAILPRGRSVEYYLTTGEIFEFTAAYVYFMAALYFYRRKDDQFLGKDIKEIIGNVNERHHTPVLQ